MKMRLWALTLVCIPGGPGPATAAPGHRPPLADRGVFSDLDRRVRLHVPEWLRQGPALLVTTTRPSVRLLLVAGVPVAFEHAGARDRGWPRLALKQLDPKNDADADGIPDALDLLIGAKKTVLNGAAYTGGYRKLAFPNGDVPRGIGVCTDVVIRALRNAGHDLQTLVHRDIRRAPRAYRHVVRRPDANIDHRRVRTLLPYFRRHWTQLPADPVGTRAPLLPGDIVFLNTLGDAAPDHIGIVSDRPGPSGRPLIINNWTNGHRTAEMDLLRFVPVTHRFRLQPLRLPSAAGRGPAALLRRRGIVLDPAHRQVVLVTAPLWSSSAGELRRFTRRGPKWRQVGRAVGVRLGSAGLGRGRGLHGNAALSSGPRKREGDRRSPAGAFSLGVAFGPGPRPFAGRWPWRAVDARDRFVDDPASPHYNTWRRAPLRGAGAWRSAEELSRYRLALLVQHNTHPVKAGAGSAIFLHLPSGGPTVGCTALPRKELLALLSWLRPDKKPVLVQIPGTILR